MMHRLLVRVPAVSAVALLAASCTDAVPVAPRTPSDAPALAVAKGGGGTTAAPGRYLVGLDASSPSLSAAALAASGGRIVDSIPSMQVLVVDGVTNPSALQQGGARYVESEFQVNTEAYIEPALDPVESITAATPTDAAWYASGVQWDIKAMRADQAWALGARGGEASVCIVDTGVDNVHQELNGTKVAARANFVTTAGQTGPTQFLDGNGHGSHVAGEAAGWGVVTAGVAPDATVYGARVLDNSGSGSETAIVNGINWCVAQGAQVINMSLGGIRYLGQPGFTTSPVTYGLAINAATAAGVVVVVSAGNSNLQLPNPSQIVVPAQVAGTLIVGATGPVSKTTAPAVPAWDPTVASQVWQGVDGKAFYSNFGTIVNVFAPGGRGGIPFSYEYYRFNQVSQGLTRDNIYGVCASTTSQSGNPNTGGAPGTAGTCLGQSNRYIAYAGTSMAAPHVTGLAALLYSELHGVRNAANRARVMSCIQSTTDVIGPATTFGGGRVNARAAVEALRAGQC